MNRLPIIAAGLMILMFSTSPADELTCNWQADRRVGVESGWIEVEQGRDESSQRLRLAVWGSDRIAVSCEQLDDDPEQEVAIVSTVVGTGPYYRLQIVDFLPDGILTWSYWSEGSPKLENGRVLLGVLQDGYPGAASTPTYTQYQFPDSGLIPEPSRFRVE